MKPPATIVVSLALVATTAAGLWYWKGREANAPRRNVILISIDTLRPDHLGCYGYTIATSPAIDRFCRDSVTFTEAYAAAPVTLMSHATFFTSLIPHHHRASYQELAGLSDEVLTLAEIFKAEQYSTFAVAGGGQMDAAYGLAQGFDVYESDTSFPTTITRALSLLDQRSANPFFLFLHTYDVHMPYRHTPEALETVDPGYQGTFPSDVTLAMVDEFNSGTRALQPADRRRLVSLYDAGILLMDRQFGRLMDELRKRGLYDDALIVLVSDHGEEFGEHGMNAKHSHTLFDELLRIPLVVKFPGAERASERVTAMIRGVDLAPGIVALAGLPVPPVFQGRDMFQSIDPDDDPDSLAVLRREVSPGDQALWQGVRTTEWKLYGPRLFDLRRDPGETTDVAAKHPRVAEALAAARDTAVRAHPGSAIKNVRPSDALRERLRSLGYTGGRQ